MSVLINHKNDEKELIVSCSCGCDESVHIQINSDDDELYMFMTYLSSDFFREQHGAFYQIAKKAKKIWKIIRNKDYYYGELCMTKQDFEYFKEYINSVK